MVALTYVYSSFTRILPINLKQLVAVPADRLVEHLGVDLRHLNATVAEHLGQRLDRYIVGQHHRRGKGMPGDVAGQRLIDTRQMRYELKQAIVRLLAIHG